MKDRLLTFNNPTPEQLRAAPMATLLLAPITPSARRLEDHLYDITIEAEDRTKPRKRKRAAAMERNFRSTISAFVADLISSAENEASVGFCFRPLVSTSFTDTLAFKRQFDAVQEAWEAMGLLESDIGFQGREDFDGEEIKGKRWATRFRATPALLSMAAEYDITATTVKDNYKAETAKTFPIELRAKKGVEHGAKGRGMKVDRSDPKVLQLAADLREVNQFLSEHTFNFGPSPTFRRVFNNGDQADFDWNQGGRLISGGKDVYQQWKSERRKDIKIDGEDVVELDFRSSQPTLAYALAEEPLPSGDLYDVDGLPRLVVKNLMTAHLGKGSRPTQWPEGTKAKYKNEYGRDLGKDLKLYECVDAVEAAHPILLRLNDHGIDVYRLQYVESKIILRAMLNLIRDHQVPSLPVHDCLIVRYRDQNVAQAYLDEAFFSEVGIHPTITRKGG